MKLLPPSFPDQTRRQVRRAWRKYGILWSGAVVVGLVAVLYARLIDVGFSLFLSMQQAYFWLPLCITPAVGAACVWITCRFFPGSEGSGIPQVIAALEDNTTARGHALLSLRVVVGKIALSFMAIAGGFTIGREGPTVQLGAALMFNLRQMYPRSSAALERRLILAGAAAGLSAAFNTPLAGIVFAIEELTRSFEHRASGVVITVIIFAGVVALGLNGNYTYFGTIRIAGAISNMIVLAVLAVLVTGIVTGIAGGLFGWLLLNTERWIPLRLRHLRSNRPVAFGALCGLLVALIGIVAAGATFGSGYSQARSVLEERGHLSALYPLLKMAAMVGSYLPGIPGGIFAPSLSIGAGFGNLLHLMFANTSLPMLIALAMVGYLAAVTQSPITAFVIVMEMIDGHALVISLMATALIASRVSRLFAPPLYDALSQRYRTAIASSASLLRSEAR